MSSVGIKNIRIGANEKLVVVDKGEVSGEAVITVEAGGFLRYFFVPTRVSPLLRKEGVRGRYENGEVAVESFSDLTPALSSLRRGGTMTCRTLRVELREDAHAEIYGAILAEHENQYQFNLLVHHLGPRSQSKTLFKGVGKDNSKQIFNGMIKIDKQAHQANAFLENRVLLLPVCRDGVNPVSTVSAKAESKPELEIEANDVKASHAATTGRIDDRQLFYLQSRGIERDIAQQMIIEGFLTEVFVQLPNKERFIR